MENEEWVTSDLHLYHKNIIEFEKDNLLKNNIYINSIEEYNDMIVNRINSYVKNKDTLYILGDFCFGGTEKIKEMCEKINGKKILLFGNHDKYGQQQALNLGFRAAIYGPYFLPSSRGTVLMSHIPPQEALNNKYISLCMYGHLHGCSLDLERFVNVNIAMNEYKPLKIKDLIEKYGRTPNKRFEPWLQEWYAPYQIFSRDREDIPLTPQGKIDFTKIN